MINLSTLKKNKFRTIILGFALIFGLDFLYLASFLPSIVSLDRNKIQESAFIAGYREQAASDRKLPSIKWTPTKAKLSKKIKMAFIIAEDSRFYSHIGIDFQALWDAVHYNLRRQKFAIGASTISQQTAKNLYLSSSRSLLRKWHELILTLWIEAFHDKETILHIYLNIAEFGRGVFGIEAASQRYFFKSASQLSVSQAMQLAATLPSPKKSNPGTRSKFFVSRTKKIEGVAGRYYSYLYPGLANDDPELTELDLAIIESMEDFDEELQDTIEEPVDIPPIDQETRAFDREGSTSNPESESNPGTGLD